jgi:AcrR family transcriptional regulator
MAADAVSGGMSEPDGSAERTLAGRGQTTRDRLVEVGWEVFEEKPYRHVRIAEVAARAGVSTGSFYTYFDSKEALFRVVASEAMEQMFFSDRLDPDNPEQNPVRDIAYGTREFFLSCVRFRTIAQSIEWVRVVDSEVHLNRRGRLMRGAKRIEHWVKSFQEQGLCDPNVDPWFTALALQSMTINLAYEQLVFRERPQDVEALVAAVVPIWARALGLERWLYPAS